MLKYLVLEDPSMKLSAIGLAVIAIVAAISMVLAPIPKPALAAILPTNTPEESVIGNGIGTLTCSNGISYPNTQISFNLLLASIGSHATVISQPPPKGSVTLTATVSGVNTQTQGTNLFSGDWQQGTMTYVVEGTVNPDNICGATGSQFTLSGTSGSSIPISMNWGLNTFRGTGNVVAKSCLNC